MHTRTNTHTQSNNLNAPLVLLQMQPANSSLVGSGARYSMASTSEEHSVMDPDACVVSALVLKDASMFSGIQYHQFPYLSLQINLQ